MNRTIVLASDHAGLIPKDKIIDYLKNKGFTNIVDCGCFENKSCDYPDYAQEGSRKIKEIPNSIGIFICGTGIGISIAANRFEHINACICHSVTEVKLSKKYNCNVLAIGERSLGIETMYDLVDEFLKDK